MAPLPSEIHIFYGNIGCRDAYRETLNLVRVADDSLTHKGLPMRHSASTIDNRSCEDGLRVIVRSFGL